LPELAEAGNAQTDRSSIGDIKRPRNERDSSSSHRTAVCWSVVESPATTNWQVYSNLQGLISPNAICESASMKFRVRRDNHLSINRWLASHRFCFRRILAKHNGNRTRYQLARCHRCRLIERKP
jgi:hypothetical protein